MMIDNPLNQAADILQESLQPETPPVEPPAPPVEPEAVEPAVDEETPSESGAALDDDAPITDLGTFFNEVGVEPDEAYRQMTVPMGTGVDPVSLSELKDYYQKNKLSGTNVSTLQSQNNQLRDQLAQVQQFQNTAPPIAKELQDAEVQIQNIHSQFNQIDWKEFEQQNPGEAALQRQKMQEALNYAITSRNQMAQNLEGAANQRKQEFLNYQQAQVRQLIPEWSDPVVAQRESTEMAAFLGKYGFHEKEISNINEARVLNIVRDFMLLQGKVNNAKPETKKVQRPTATLTAGALRTAKKSREQQQAEIVSGVKGSQDRNQQVEAISKLLSV